MNAYQATMMLGLECVYAPDLLFFGTTSEGHEPPFHREHNVTRLRLENPRHRLENPRHRLLIGETDTSNSQSKKKPLQAG